MVGGMSGLSSVLMVGDSVVLQLLLQSSSLISGEERSSTSRAVLPGETSSSDDPFLLPRSCPFSLKPLAKGLWLIFSWVILSF